MNYFEVEDAEQTVVWEKRRLKRARRKNLFRLLLIVLAVIACSVICLRFPIAIIVFGILGLMAGMFIGIARDSGESTFPFIDTEEIEIDIRNAERRLRKAQNENIKQFL